ncbi:DUF6053 domain-containing protein [Lysobacter enzymogenes]|uniref:DUF6053 domain-containing protein n=1 Tax=Lysobacter enzymogenes TaxID=69 RepID=UPI003D18DE23
MRRGVGSHGVHDTSALAKRLSGGAATGYKSIGPEGPPTTARASATALLWEGLQARCFCLRPWNQSLSPNPRPRRHIRRQLL